jgi:hypothetical protein
MTMHLVLQIADGLPRPVPAAADIAEHLLGDSAAAVAIGQQAVERQARDLRHRVPHGDLDGADRDRAFGIAADLLAPAHRGKHAGRIVLPVSSRSESGSARRMRGMKRSRIWAPQA